MIQRVFWLFYIVIVTFQTGTKFEAFFATMRSFYNAKQCFFSRKTRVVRRPASLPPPDPGSFWACCGAETDYRREKEKRKV